MNSTNVYSTEVEGVTKQYNLTVKELAKAGLYQEIHEITKAAIEGYAESYRLGNWLTANEVMLNTRYRILRVLPSIDWDHISSKYLALMWIIITIYDSLIKKVTLGTPVVLGIA